MAKATVNIIVLLSCLKTAQSQCADPMQRVGAATRVGSSCSPLGTQGHCAVPKQRPHLHAWASPFGACEHRLMLHGAEGPQCHPEGKAASPPVAPLGPRSPHASSPAPPPHFSPMSQWCRAGAPVPRRRTQRQVGAVLCRQRWMHTPGDNGPARCSQEVQAQRGARSQRSPLSQAVVSPLAHPKTEPLQWGLHHLLAASSAAWTQLCSSGVSALVSPSITSAVLCPLDTRF